MLLSSLSASLTVGANTVSRPTCTFIEVDRKIKKKEENIKTIEDPLLL